MELFERPKILRFEKVAVPFTKMTGAVDRWPEVILQALVQQVPYIANFEMSVHITKVDAAQGYGFGFIAVKVPTDRSLEEQAGPRPVPYLRVPVIVKDWQLLPFDLFMKENTVYPLTQKRVEEALHSTEIFDVASKAPPDASIAQDMMPPAHGTAGMGSGYAGAGVTKQAFGAGAAIRQQRTKDQAAGVKRNLLWGTTPVGQPSRLVSGVAKPQLQKKAFLCEALGHSFIDPADMKKAAEALKDEATAWHADRHPVAMHLLSAISDPASREKLASADPLENFEATVVQIERRSDGGFIMKAASHHAFRPVIENVSTERARGVMGERVMKLAHGDTITVVRDAVVTQDPLEKTASLVDVAGMWSVWDPTGQRAKLAGVFTRVMDLDGTVLNTKLAHVIGSGYALQQKVAGARQLEQSISEVYNHSAPLRGRGFMIDPKTASATVPFQVTGMGEIEGRTEIYVKSDMGKKASLEIVKGLHSPTKLAEDRFAIPSHFRFCPIGEKMARVSDSPRSIEKRANSTRDYVEVIGDSSGSYTLSSPHLVDLGATSYKQIKEAQALFLLGAMGVDPAFATKKLAWARVHGPVTFRGIHPITTSGEVGGRIKEALAQVGTRFEELFATRICLVKEAMEIDNPDTVDKILGLNFLRPENVQMYVNYLPELEEAVTKLGDLLFSARVGLSPISEDAVRKALFALEETVQQLKILAQTGLNAEATQVA